MTKNVSESDRAVFVSELQAANNQISEQVALDVYNVLDAIQVLLAIPEGQRIVANRNKDAARD